MPAAIGGAQDHALAAYRQNAAWHAGDGEQIVDTALGGQQDIFKLQALGIAAQQAPRATRAKKSVTDLAQLGDALPETAGQTLPVCAAIDAADETVLAPGGENDAVVRVMSQGEPDAFRVRVAGLPAGATIVRPENAERVAQGQDAAAGQQVQA